MQAKSIKSYSHSLTWGNFTFESEKYFAARKLADVAHANIPHRFLNMSFGALHQTTMSPKTTGKINDHDGEDFIPDKALSKGLTQLIFGVLALL